MALLTWRDARQGRGLPPYLRSLPAWGPLLVHVFLAVAYTTPWDNYLVATRVWYYNPALVSGVTLGWVPIEEYTFFVLQTLLAGLWLLWLARRLPADPAAPPGGKELRRNTTMALGALWLASILLLASGWQPGVYLGLILVWALPPIMLQLAFGADLLWRHRRLVALSILSTTLYLALTDSLAIGGGTWTIDPGQSLHLFLGGVLPVEELLFFFVTNTLIAFGITLALAEESQGRIRAALRLLASLTPTRRRDENYS
jgi:lycopene cyclase domain-containing protein